MWLRGCGQSLRDCPSACGQCAALSQARQIHSPALAVLSFSFHDLKKRRRAPSRARKRRFQSFQDFKIFRWKNTSILNYLR
jgi:hypothetical protein